MSTQLINDRIELIVNQLFNGNISAFAKSIGVGSTTISDIIKGRRNKPSSDTLTNIIAVNTMALNAEWLLTGKGEMLQADNPIISYQKGTPYYNVDFIGGFDLVCNDQTTKPDYYIDFSPYNEEGTIWCNITGHSMEPEINNGDMIALKEVKEWNNFLTYGEIYAIVTKNGMRTVKIVSRGDDNDSFKLVPINENKKYSIQDIQKSMIDKVFKVMGCMKRL